MNKQQLHYQKTSSVKQLRIESLFYYPEDYENNVEQQRLFILNSLVSKKGFSLIMIDDENENEQEEESTLLLVFSEIEKLIIESIELQTLFISKLLKFTLVTPNTSSYHPRHRLSECAVAVKILEKISYPFFSNFRKLR